MARTLHNIATAETGGLGLLTASSGTPTASTAQKRTGEYSYLLAAADWIEVIEVISGGVDNRAGFFSALRVSALPASTITIFEARNSDSEIFASIQLNSSGDLIFLDRVGGTVGTASTAVSAATWFTIEWLIATSATPSVSNSRALVDGTEIFSLTNQDHQATPPNSSLRRFLNPSGSGITINVDDILTYAATVTATDELGNAEIFGYQSGLAAKTSDIEDDLSASGGNWSDTGDRPWADETDANSARFEDTGNLQGAVFFNDTNAGGDSPGPASGADDVSGTIIGAMYFWRADRGSGGGRTHTLYYGSDNNTAATLAGSTSIASIAGPTSTTPANFSVLSTNATLIPSATDDFAMGAGKSATGGQDTFIKEMQAFLLHQPAASPFLQDSFHFRDDDGNETTAAFKGSLNSDQSLLVDTNFRLRLQVSENDAGAVSFSGQLQYNLNSGGWNDVNAASSVVRSTASPNVADGATTTEQLAGAGTFTAGTFDEVDGLVPSKSLDNNETEHEYCFQIRAADVSNSDTIDFRLVDGVAGTVFGTYTQTPTATVIKDGARLLLMHPPRFDGEL